MALCDDRMPVNITGALYLPVICVFCMETAGVADEIVYLSVFILAGSNPINFVAIHPYNGLARAGGAIAVSVHRIEEPYTALETEGTVGKCAYRTNINHVAAELAFD